MANTAISDIASQIVQNRAWAKVQEGPAGADMKPGQFVVFYQGKFELATSGTAAHKLIQGGVVVYVKRMYLSGSTQIYPSIDDIYDIDTEPYLEYVGVCTDGICACFITDQGGTVYPKQNMGLSATAGSLTVSVATETVQATLARKVGNGDTVGFVALGRDRGRTF